MPDVLMPPPPPPEVLAPPPEDGPSSASCWSMARRSPAGSAPRSSATLCCALQAAGRVRWRHPTRGQLQDPEQASTAAAAAAPTASVMPRRSTQAGMQPVTGGRWRSHRCYPAAMHTSRRANTAQKTTIPSCAGGRRSTRKQMANQRISRGGRSPVQVWERCKQMANEC